MLLPPGVISLRGSVHSALTLGTLSAKALKTPHAPSQRYTSPPVPPPNSCPVLMFQAVQVPRGKVTGCLHFEDASRAAMLGEQGGAGLAGGGGGLYWGLRA